MSYTPKLSAVRREIFQEELSSEYFDLVVIGGGVTGAGIALDAASRGLRTALIEARDFGEGTSGRTTKLVHGGLRYLEQMEFNLVRKMGHERELLYQHAAHIISPQRMLLPVTVDGKLTRPYVWAGLWIYDKLAGVKPSEKHKRLKREDTLSIEPLLDNPRLKGGALYYEYATSDSRLVIEIIKTAAFYGAICQNHCILKAFIKKEGKITAVDVHDVIAGIDYRIYARQIVNATGIWVDEVRQLDDPKIKKILKITKGTHIVVKRDRLPVRCSVYFDAIDNRMIFAIPRGNRVYIGTTDTDYHGPKYQPKVENNDIEYLIESTNRMFPKARLKEQDIISVWAGLRPLINQFGKRNFDVSRRDAITCSKSGLISIAGGKLSGYRLMAKKVTDLVQERLSRLGHYRYIGSRTRAIPLSGGQFGFVPDKQSLQMFFDEKYDQAKQTGITPDEFRELGNRYGTNIDLITEKAYEFFNQTHNTAASWLKAEIWYGCEYEMITTLDDYFIRRTEMAIFDPVKTEMLIEPVANELAEIFRWSPEKKQAQMDEFRNTIQAYYRFQH